MFKNGILKLTQEEQINLDIQKIQQKARKIGINRIVQKKL